MTLSASRIALGRHCLYWARPDVERPSGGEEERDDSNLGTAAHESGELAVRGERVDLEKIAEKYGVDVADLAPLASTMLVYLSDLRAVEDPEQEASLVAPEMAFAIDPFNRKARVLSCKHHRDYSDVASYEVACTVDMVTVWAHGSANAADWKTGGSDHSYASHQDQMRCQEMAVALWLGSEAVTSTVVHVAPTVTADGNLVPTVRQQTECMSRFDRETFLEELKDMLTEVPGAQAKPGLHCDEYRCPARAVCPATKGLLHTMGLDLDGKTHLPVVGDVTSPEQATAVLVAADLIEEWIAERKLAVQAYADRNGGFMAPDGRTYQGREETRETVRLEVSGALAAMATVLSHKQIAACVRQEPRTSFEAIEAAIRISDPKAPVADIMRDVRDALRDAGALKKSTFQKYGWKKKGKKQ